MNIEYIQGVATYGSTTSPNVGHTFFWSDRKYVTHLIPVCVIVHDRCGIYFSSEAVINKDLLFKEMDEFNIDPSRLLIHPRAPIITEREIQEEQQIGGIEKIASTQSGVGAARANKIMRKATLAENDKQRKEFTNSKLLRSYLKSVQDLRVTVETGQGLGLDINHGLAYPYCTSRSILPATILGELGLHPKYIGNILLSFRAFPIRVGNPTRDGREVGFSGPFFSDSKEITFSDIGVEDELTTVTKRVRRVATFSMTQYMEAIDIVEPTHIFLNFVNYFEQKENDIPMFPKGYEPTHVGYGPYPDQIRKYETDIIQRVIK